MELELEPDTAHSSKSFFPFFFEVLFSSASGVIK